MRRLKKLIIPIIILSLLIILTYRACKYDWSPHYIDNNAVAIDKIHYSPDSSIAVIYYTLDVGARGLRSYKSLIRNKDYKKDLFVYNLPPELVVDKWVNNQTLFAKYDPNEIYRLGATYSELDFNKDTLVVNDIKIVITERIPMNKK